MQIPKPGQFSSKEHLEHAEWHFFWLWPSARAAEEEAIALVSEDFDIRAIAEVEWPKVSTARCFNRIYARNLQNHWSREMSAGSGASLLILVQDPNPTHGWFSSASGATKWINLNIVKKKIALRAICSGEYAYSVHSSTNAREFDRDMTLTLGSSLLSKFTRRDLETTLDSENRISVKRPLDGDSGWDSWSHFFSVLRDCEPFVLLSGEQSLNNSADTGDVDILTESIWSFAASANAELEYPGSQKPRFLVKVGGEQRLLDLRETGDGDSPILWQELLLQSARLENEIPRIRQDLEPFLNLYKDLVQRRQARDLVSPLELLEIPGRSPDSSLQVALSALAGFFVGSRIPLVGVNKSSIGNRANWDELVARCRSISEQAEPSWQYTCDSE